MYANEQILFSIYGLHYTNNDAFKSEYLRKITGYNCHKKDLNDTKNTPTQTPWSTFRVEVFPVLSRSTMPRINTWEKRAECLVHCDISTHDGFWGSETPINNLHPQHNQIWTVDWVRWNLSETLTDKRNTVWQHSCSHNVSQNNDRPRPDQAEHKSFPIHCGLYS